MILKKLKETDTWITAPALSSIVLVLEERSKEKVLSKVGDMDCKVVFQTDPESRQADSLRLGIRASLGYNYYMSYPIDFPLVGTSTINKLIKMAELTNADLISPVFEGRRGHPFMLSNKASLALLDMGKDLPLNHLFRMNDLSIKDCCVDDRAILQNLNTEEILKEIPCVR
jgi:molybdenum cofactor cytidylyltransferase